MDIEKHFFLNHFILADVVVDVDWGWESSSTESVSQLLGMILLSAEEMKSGPHVVWDERKLSIS